MAGYSGTRPNRDDLFTAVGGMSVTKADADISFPSVDKTLAVSAPRFPRGFAVGDAGTIKITTSDGSVLTYIDGELAKGVTHPISVVRVWSTGTSATIFKIYW